jgi:alpha-1,2-mannosyltransferase
MSALRSQLPRLVLIGFLLVHGAAGLWTALNQRGVDFAVYYLAAKVLPSGINIYTLSDADWASLATQYHVPEVTPPYRYPPLTAGFLAWFVGLPYPAALLAWSALSVAVTLLSGLVLSRVVSQRWIDPLVFAALTLYVPILTTVYAGQVNTFVLLGLALYLTFSQRRPFASGLSLAAGIALKPLAAPLMAHLAWRRERRKIAAVAAGLIVVAALSVALAGLQANLDYLANAVQLSTLSVDAGPVTYPPNQSVFGFFGRLLTSNEHGAALADNAPLARLLSIAVAGLLVIGVAFLTWPRKNGAETFALETGLVLVTTNLVFPISWYHHAVISIIPLLLAWHGARARAERLCLLVAFVLIDAQGLLWHRFEGLTLLLSLGTYGLLFIYAVTAALVYRSKKNPASPTRPFADSPIR